MTNSEIINWLLKGDISIQFQVYRDLLSEDRPELKSKIASEGWGAKLLACRNDNGHWGRGFYQTKWISTHYTLLDLRNLNLPEHLPEVMKSIDLIIRHEKSADGGINPTQSIAESDICICGMFLNYTCYFGAEQEGLKSVVDFILSQQMKDGGFNCRLNRSGAVHGSLHSTLSVAEGISEYLLQGYAYRSDELKQAELKAREFMLLHRLFLSDRTGEIINKNFLCFPYPSRWYYDILRALDYFRSSGAPFDERINPAIQVLQQKRRKDNRWNQQAKHPGKEHFEMEIAGQPGRWNTLRAMRVLKYFKILEFDQ
jgi:hypothetical protein